MKRRKVYPDLLPVFEIISLDGHDVDVLKVGDHVEGAGPCCLGTDRQGSCGVMVINGAPSELDEYLWARNLRPLTPFARRMRGLVNR